MFEPKYISSTQIKKEQSHENIQESEQAHDIIQEIERIQDLIHIHERIQELEQGLHKLRETVYNNCKAITKLCYIIKDN